MARLKVPIQWRIRNSRRDPKPALPDAVHVVIDDDMPLANDAHAARAGLAVTEKEVAIDDAPVPVAQGQHAGAIQEGVGAICILAGLVGNDLDLAVALLKQILFHSRPGIGHRLMTVTNADGLAPVPAQGRARSEMIMIEPMIIRVAGDFDLHGRRIVGLGGEIAMVDPIAAPVKVQMEFVVAAHHGAFGEAARGAHHFDARPGGGGIGKKEPVHDDMLALDEHGGISREHHAAGCFGAKHDRPFWLALSTQREMLVGPPAIPQ